MSRPGVEAAGLWKKFRRGPVSTARFRSLARRALGFPARDAGLAAGEFWALRDVDFRVGVGQALGVIGANGAGKSTLLKLITGVLEPTHGRCAVHGRVGALIELAAGFHPDLTGRENVFLQGAVMGMTRAEIVRRFDDIVAFSGIEDFIDTPVKRYSSGMNARLGFAIAAHLEPDVLVIDEVLAVGDFAFQTRAFDRIRDLVGRGTPVVVVSHQLDRIATLCNRAIYLDHGRIARVGTPAECIAAYVRSAGGAAPEPGPDAPLRVLSVALCPPRPVPSGTRVEARLVASARAAWRAPTQAIGLRVRGLEDGHVVYDTDSVRCGQRLPDDGDFELGLALQMNVPAGLYALETGVWDAARRQQVARGPAVTVQVRESSVFWGPVQMNPRLRLRPAPPAPPDPVGARPAAAADAGGGVDISVVLCTRDRSRSLRRTLASFTRQVVPPTLLWELLIVDNGSTDATGDVIAEFAERLPLRRVLEPRPGAGRARNAGIRASRGDIIAFTDDDCLPAPDWLARLALEFRAEPELAGLGGRVELADPADRPISIQTSARRDRLAGPDQLFGGIPGCNTAFVRCVFVSVGLYDPGFGPGTPLPAAEHADLAYRVLRAGFRVDYVPELVVRHAHGRRNDDAVGEAHRRYVVGRGGFYTKHILRGDLAILRAAYREVSGAMRQMAERRRADTPVEPLVRDVRHLFLGMVRGVPRAWRPGGRLPAAAPRATAPIAPASASPAPTSPAAAAPLPIGSTMLAPAAPTNPNATD